ncbi:MAG: HAMP domain-containing sensor histidine kinase [Candidatus Marinimicrobia bacterium]|nr:HAMP domain-containing sensor histidine kinase [Candidatus Neomarinimicrobiota bacterium]
MQTSKMKIVFISISLIFILGILLYSHKIVNDLRNDSKGILTFYTELYAEVASNEELGEFFFDKMIAKISFPIIVTDMTNLGINAYRNIPKLDKNDSTSFSLSKKNKKILLKYLKEMDKYSTPIPLYFNNPIDSGKMIIGYIHYGDSVAITRLKWMPYIEIFGVLVIILIGFFGLQYIRTSEKKFIWVGLAKETAHQLGTPISSLLGWIELAKAKYGSDTDIFNEMSIDITRLEKISHRFSQIGSNVPKKIIVFKELLDNVEKYIIRRIPQKNNHINLEFIDKSDSKILGNIELLEWAMENIIKNAVDSLEGKSGEIKIISKLNSKNQIVIDIADSGKGIESSKWSKIFDAGFSTKVRGWGLGLSLVKRIIEEYHNGKIFVYKSKKNIGTTFRIILP